MKQLELVQQEHTVKVGDPAPNKTPNVTEDTLFLLDGTPVGFYIKDLAVNYPEAANFANIADAELRSDRVPKQNMLRASGVKQYSTIIGGVPKKGHLGRHYNKTSSVHLEKTAQTFVKAMWKLALASEEIIKELTPELYKTQKEIFDNHVPEQWRFGNLFTSSISNYNISAAHHQDKANIKNCVNVIIAKRQHSKGGNTTVPDYDITVDSADNSMLVYPAWANIHAVTPIHLDRPEGYRNTLVFYPLKAFYEEKI
jgi:hypothetical protein